MENEQTYKELLTDSVRLTEELESLTKKVAIYCYNLERSFVDNVKEISGNGWTAEEVRERYGL